MNTAFFDIDTQIDFVFPAGALYVPGAELVLPQVARLNRHAKERGIPLISTADAHAENDPEFAEWPPHCVAGTLGQRKPDCTMAGQIVLNKQS
ncbi:MAG: cysteine hydrolase family protein, partial [Bryobacteraceae bacterium]